jgi:L-asparaginase
MKWSDTILVLTTGGTIDKQYCDPPSGYQVTDTTVRKLLAIARVTHAHRVKELLHKDSLELTDEDRKKIVRSVRKSKLSRFVITHGTDTMTNTARMLARVDGKRIVLTGAFTPSRFNESDASFNLGLAFAAVQTVPPGVYITMNGRVFRWEEVEKDRQQGCFILKRVS